MTTRSTTSNGKDGTPSQTKLTFQTKTNLNPRPTSPTQTEGENEEFQLLIEKAITWKLMSKDDECHEVLPTKLLRLAAAAKEPGRTKTALNEVLDRIALIAKILQEWSWKERKTEIIENFEESLTVKAKMVGERVEEIATEAQAALSKLEEMTSRVTEISTKIATLGNSLPDRQQLSGKEDGEIANDTSGTSYAHIARTNVTPSPPIHHHQHNSAVRDVEIRLALKSI
ncbi:hypothetical protein C8R42DRAFT_727110 [Lentinula raphanica]|nr:hypothetical protein C8R42DRAFT_727110 [Lentinula raphanica]